MTKENKRSDADQVKNLPGWRDINFACIVFDPGNSKAYLTGDWRSLKPVHDYEKCVKCGECWMYCPDASIYIDEKGDYIVNMDYCKGCGICARECPKDVITMVPEEE